jgi:hypothetical protein
VPINITTLRELFRNLVAWQAVFEAEGIDTVMDNDGETWCLWDIQYLYEHGLPRLPARQREAIELFLIQNVKESVAAKMMGISPTNPIGMYATDGLRTIVNLVNSGALPRFLDNKEESA